MVDTSGTAQDKLDECLNKILWNIVNDKLNNYFDSITLEDLVNKYKKKILLCIIYNM